MRRIYWQWFIFWHLLEYQLRFGRAQMPPKRFKFNVVPPAASSLLNATGAKPRRKFQ
jgi:hypothetical protein